MKLRHLFFACSGVFVMMFSLLLLVVIVSRMRKTEEAAETLSMGA